MNLIQDFLTYCVYDNVCSGSQVLDELSIIKRTDSSIYAELLECFRFPRVSYKGCKLKVTGVRMIEETLQNRAADIA